MSVFSSLRHFLIGGGLGSSRLAVKPLALIQIKKVLTKGVRHGSGGGGHGRKMVIKPSEYVKRRLFDEFHYQFFLVLTPFALLLTYVNVFIGDATLAEIPEGYEPDQWEYYKHPIERWFARHVHSSQEVAYEMTLSCLQMWICDAERKRWQNKCKELMQDRQDYKAWYYVPVDSHGLEKNAALYDDRMRGVGEAAYGNLRRAELGGR